MTWSARRKRWLAVMLFGAAVPLMHLVVSVVASTAVFQTEPE